MFAHACGAGERTLGALEPADPCSGGSGTMAGLQQGEKQLFEKFWRGTFKAVASPRPESIIVASITARKSVTNAEPSTCQAHKADQSQTEPADVTAVTTERRRRIKARARKHGSRRRMRSLSSDGELAPRPSPKGKKKKKKSERKRRRKRSPSYSLSPVRKKKKKKSSKKRKRNRSASKKRRRSFTSSKSKRKEDRKHKKRSRSRAHRRRRYRRSESESSAWRCSSADSRHLRRSAERAQSRGPARHPSLRQNGHESEDRTGFDWRPVTKSACTIPPNFHSAPSTGSIAQSSSGGDIFTKKGFAQDVLSSQSRGRQDYDSGNDTSSPPSTKTNSSRSKVNDDKQRLGVELPTPEKLRFTDGDNASDSGNSVTSYSSLCKPLPLEKGSANHVNGSRQSEPAHYGSALGRPKFGGSPDRSPSPPHGRSRTYSRSSSRSRSRSRSRTRSSRSSGRSLRYSHSRSLSSRRSYSHSPSYAANWRSRRSTASASSHRSSSYSRGTLSRSREPERGHKKHGSSEKQARRGRERHRRRSYTPMRKRRRDSPSHLEARRITSARKRPIPYYRPSPSTSSRSTSYSSLYSLFARSRSRTLSRSRSRSRSFSSYRSYSRSSWSTLSGRSRSRSRSRSYDSVGSYGRSRR